MCCRPSGLSSDTVNGCCRSGGLSSCHIYIYIHTYILLFWNKAVVEESPQSIDVFGCLLFSYHSGRHYTGDEDKLA